MGGWSSPSSGGSIPSSRTGPETITSADSNGVALTVVGPSSTPAVIIGNSQFRPGSLSIGFNFSDGTTGCAFGAGAGSALSGASKGFWIAGTNGMYGFTAGTLLQSLDTAIAKNAAGVIEVNNGTAGIFRDLKLRSIIQNPPASVAPANNGELVVEATSNTTLTFKLKGTDGTVRSATLTLA